MMMKMRRRMRRMKMSKTVSELSHCLMQSLNNTLCQYADTGLHGGSDLQLGQLESTSCMLKQQSCDFVEMMHLACRYWSSRGCGKNSGGKVSTWNIEEGSF